MGAIDGQLLTEPDVLSSGRALQRVADGIRESLGYGVVALGLARETGEMEYVAVSGPEDAVDDLLGVHVPIEILLRQAELSEVAGSVLYLPGAPGDSDRWHPEDRLVVLISDSDGDLRGIVAVDQPPRGRVPTLEQRRRLGDHVDQVTAVVLHADAVRRVAGQMRIAAQARSLVRRAMARHDVGELFDDCAPGLGECFGADRVWLRSDEEDRNLIHPVQSPGHAVPDAILASLRRMAVACWRSEQASVIGVDRLLPASSMSDGWEAMAAFVQAIGMETLLMAPIGAGQECLGALVLLREPGRAEWTDIEIAAALEIGRDLGVSLLNSRSFARERDLVGYKQQLIGTIAHELRNPLTSVRGHVELLQDLALPEDGGARMVSAIDRASDRLLGLVDNLLELSRVDDPAVLGEQTPVRLADVVQGSLDLLSVQADQSGVEVRTDLAGEALVIGDGVELERLTTNLVSNAIKYTDPGGTVTVEVAASAGEVTLVVGDNGIGVGPHDLDHLFVEFFRSHDPAAQRRPGTGLGLAIVGRVAQRHGGQVEVSSELGEGTTFTVRLPGELQRTSTSPGH